MILMHAKYLTPSPGLRSGSINRPRFHRGAEGLKEEEGQEERELQRERESKR